MSSEFKETSLKEVADVFTGYPFKSKKYLDDGVLKVLRGLNVKEKEINWDAGAKYWDAEFDQEEYYLEEGDIVIGMDGSKIGLNFAHLKKSDLPAILAQRVARIRAKENISQKYIRYAICNVLFTNYVNAVKTGSSIPHISKTQIENYTFPIPESLLLQEEIAENLAVIDQKIHLNQQTNETLEAMAQAIFKSWFVDFDPVRAKIEAKSAGRDPNRAAMATIAGVSLEMGWDEIEAALDQKLSNLTEDQRKKLTRTAQLFPEKLVKSENAEVPSGWGLVNINELADIVYGAPFSSKKFNSEKKGYPLIRIRDLKTFEPDNWTEEVHKKGSKVYPGDLLVGMDGEFRATYWFGIESWLNQRVLQISPKRNIPLGFLKMSIEPHLDFFERSKVGTTVIHLGKRDVDGIEILTPRQELLEKIGRVLNPMLEKMVSNMEESRNLAELRNTLLPKLISGEVGV